VESENLSRYDEEAASDVIKIQQSYEENYDKVITMMIEKVMEVELDVPKTVIANFEELLASIQ